MSAETLGSAAQAAHTSGPEALSEHYGRVRARTEMLCEPLATEDYCIQTAPEVSPPKWHLAHTTWFFETFVLLPYLPGYRVYQAGYDHLFNSYYETVGRPFPRPQRGLLARPTVAEIYAYRAHVDAVMGELLAGDSEPEAQLAARLVLGLHHEQQHQELLLTDIKHIFAFNPLRPVYREHTLPAGTATEARWRERVAGVYELGHDGAGFAFDNEGPRHRTYVQDHVLQDRLVTNGEFLEFMEAGGYRRSELWLSDGWRTAQAQGWRAPLYWEQHEDGWWHMTLGGLQPVDAHAPVCHVSHYEADAFARWRGARLPTEAEWELAAAEQAIEGNFMDSGHLAPLSAPPEGAGLRQLFGDVWEWTQSAYGPYPGYRPLAGALGEYNGKFMSDQMVLRGGSCATPADHVRATYRNFFYPGERWQLVGLRLAADR